MTAPESLFLSALADITEGRSSLTDLITAGGALSGAGERDQAVRLYKVWIAFNPDHPQLYIAHFNCSSLQSDGGDLVGAIASLNSALALNA